MDSRMSRNKRCLALGLLCISALTLVTPAAAQAEPGDGIKAENFKLSFGLDLNAGTNTNLFYETTPTQGTAWSLSVLPNLSLSTIDPKLVAFQLTWGAGYQQYLSPDTEVRTQSGFSTTLNTSAHINPKGNVSLRLEEGITRTNEAPNSPSEDSIHRIVNRAGAIFGVHPVGRTIQSHIRYTWVATFFQENDLGLQQLNKDEHQFDGRLAWTFLPRTAALLMVNYRLINYDQANRVIGTAEIPNVNSRPLRIQGGINGLVLNRLAAQALIGYGLSRYADGNSFQGIIGRAKLTYFLSADGDSSVNAGYQRTFRDSTLGNFAQSHIISAGFRQMLLDKKLNIDLTGAFELRNTALQSISGIPLANGGAVTLPDELNDRLLTVNATGTYNLRKWASIGAGYTLRSNFTDDDVIVDASAGLSEVSTGRSYNQHIVNIFARLVY